MRQWLRRVWYVIRRRSVEAELAEEIEFHRAMKTREIEARGNAPAQESASASDARARRPLDVDVDVERAVRRALGNDLLARDQARDVWIAPWLQSLSQDLRFALRLLVKDLAHTTVAILALATGLGVTNTLVTILNASHRGLPFASGDHLVYIGTRDARGQARAVSRPDFEDWRAASTAFAGLAAFATLPMNVNDEGRAPERFSGTYISANAFRLIGVAPVLGRDFVADDDRAGAAAVVILSDGVWKGRYGGDAALIGRTILVNAVPSIVIGVMPDGFGFPFKDDLWQPLAQMPPAQMLPARMAAARMPSQAPAQATGSTAAAGANAADAQARGARGLSVFGRLADGVGTAQADADLRTIAARLAAAYPETNAGVAPVVESFNAHYNGRLTDPMSLALLGAVGFVLLIACANVANLLLARSARRSREIAIRASLGATRWRIVRQLLVESLLLALLAGVCGLALAQLGVRLFDNAVADLPKPYWVRFTMDWRLFAMLAAICAGTGLLFGLAPALHVAKTDINGALKEGGRSGAGGMRARRWTGIFVVAELTLTVVLLGGAGLMLRSFVALYRADLVIDTSSIPTMQIALPAQKYATPEQRAAFYDRLQERLDALPPVAAAAISSHLPFAGARERPLEIDNGPDSSSLPGAGAGPLTATSVTIGPRYFDTLRLPLLRGRAFTDTDGAPGHDSAIVNQLFAAKFFPGEDPIGRRIRLADAAAAGSGDTGARWLTIVGEAATMRQRPFRAPDALVYLPTRAEPASAAVLIVRSAAGGANAHAPATHAPATPATAMPATAAPATAMSATATSAAATPAATTSATAVAPVAPGLSWLWRQTEAAIDPASALTPLLREELRAIDPDLPLFGVRPLHRLVSLSRWMNQVYGLMFALFATAALVLSAVGLYSVTAYSVTQRTQEIGLRIALGAPPARVLWLFARRTLTHLTIGLTLGLAGAIALGRLLGGALVLTTPTDPPTLAGVTILLTLVCTAACLIPARRATRRDALTSLRRD